MILTIYRWGESKMICWVHSYLSHYKHEKKNKVPQIVEMKTNMNLQHFLSFFGIYGKFYFWKRVYVFLNLNFLFTMNSKLTMFSYIWKHTLWHWCDKIQNGTYFMLRNPLHGWLITLGMRWWSYKKCFNEMLSTSSRTSWKN